MLLLMIILRKLPLENMLLLELDFYASKSDIQHLNENALEAKNENKSIFKAISKHAFYVFSSPHG